MKAVVLLGVVAVIVLAQDGKNNSELNECGSKFAEKIQGLCGTFLTTDEILHLLSECFEMYYKQGKTLKEINDYYIANYRDIGLESTQVSTITDVITKVQDILGGADALKQYHQKAQDLALDFIKDDQKEVDQNIKTLKDSGADEDKVKLKVCQQVFNMTTAQKKIQLENKMFALVPSDKLEPIKEQVRRVGKLLTDGPSN